MEGHQHAAVTAELWYNLNWVLSTDLHDQFTEHAREHVALTLNQTPHPAQLRLALIQV